MYWRVGTPGRGHHGGPVGHAGIALDRIGPEQEDLRDDRRLAQSADRRRAPLVLVAEDHIRAGAVESPPFANAAAPGPAHPRDDLGISMANLFEDGHRADAGCG
jgi:hypothetical protein